jgi:hypothetical protein
MNLMEMQTVSKSIAGATAASFYPFLDSWPILDILGYPDKKWDTNDPPI